MNSKAICHRLFLLFLVIGVSKTCLALPLSNSEASAICSGALDFDCGEESNPRCISSFRMCDNIADCGNGKDEADCSYLYNCPPNDLMCRDGSCVSAEFRCNGKFDCLDGSDEDGCADVPPVTSKCLPPSFFCKLDQKCIDGSMRCNGKNDCDSGEDEEGCNPSICQERDSFACEDSTYCVHGNQVCDGRNDCLDGSDEVGCNNELPSADEFSSYLFCKIDEFRCSNGKCIPLEKVCNGVPDCKHADDESSLCGKCEDYGCGVSCQNYPTGPQCSCPEDMFLSVDGKTCRHENLCEMGQLGCDQHCAYDDGKSTCSCSAGYSLSDDKIHCEVDAEYRNGNLLLTFGDTSVRSSSLFADSGSLYESIVSELRPSVIQISSLAFNQHEQKLYSVGIENTERQAALFSTNESLTESLFTGRGLKLVAYDWVADNIYYASTGLGIGVCSTDGRYCSHLITGRKPALNEIVQDYKDLIVHPKRGLLIWIDYNNAHPSGVLMTAGMDGSKPRAIGDVGYDRLHALALDYVNDKLFILEGDQLSVLDFDTLRRKVLSLPVRPHAMISFNGYLHFVSRENNHLYRSKNGSNEFVRALDGSQFSLAINNSLYYEKLLNPCQEMSCSHLCVLKPGDRSSPLMAKCMCPDKYTKLQNNTCVLDRHIDGPVSTSGKLMEQMCIEETACLNGGNCKDSYEEHAIQSPSCICGSGFDGLYCERSIAGALPYISGTSGWLVFIVFFGAILPLAALLAFCSIRQYPEVVHQFANFVGTGGGRFNMSNATLENTKKSPIAAFRDSNTRPLLKNNSIPSDMNRATAINLPSSFSNPTFASEQQMNEELLEQDMHSKMFPSENLSSPSSE